MKRKDWEQQIRWGLTAFAVIAAGTAVVFFVLHLSDIQRSLGFVLSVLRPVIYGAVMAYLTAPVYNRLVALCDTGSMLPLKARGRRKIGKLLGSVVCLLIFLLIGFGLIYLIIPELYRSIQNLIQILPGKVNDTYWLLQQRLDGDSELRARVLEAYNTATDYAEGYLHNTVLPHIQELIGSLSQSIWNALLWIKDVVIGLVVMVYLLNIKEGMRGQARKLCYAFLPKRWATNFIRELTAANQIFGRFFMGKLLDSLIIGIICFFCMKLLGMPYVLLISMIIGVTNIVPFFGPFVGAIPAFILILLVSPLKSLYFLVFILVLQQFDGNILGPKILQDSTGISSFWVLFSILLFGGLFGFVGMVVAVPVWAVLMNFLERAARRSLVRKAMPTDSESYMGDHCNIEERES